MTTAPVKRDEDKRSIERHYLLVAASIEGSAERGDSLLIAVEGEERFTGEFLAADSIRVLAVGAYPSIKRRAGEAELLDFRDSVLIPGLVNSHAHLDLTHIGPMEHDHRSGFRSFVETVRSNRKSDDSEIAESVRRGIALSLAGGVVAIGDIAGSPRPGSTLSPWRALRDSPLRGVSFLEYFAIGKVEEKGLTNARRTVEAWKHEAQPWRDGMKFGLQPHATNTVSLRGYGEDFGVDALGASLPASTHLAETPEEHRFIAEATGPQREMLEDLGIWDSTMLSDIGHGRTPVEHLAGVLRTRRMLAAHVNDASDDDIELLRQTGTTVVYCPRASEYFGAAEAFGPHRYREMMSRGVRVTLGTDSILNLPRQTSGTGAGASARISVFDEMRLLWKRDGTDPGVLLHMGTVAGAKALGLSPNGYRFGMGSEPIGIVAIPVDEGADPAMERALSGDSRPRLLFIRK